MTSRLSFDAKNVKSPNFEAGVVKILAGKEATLTAAEKKCVVPLLRPCCGDPTTSSAALSLVERAKKRRKTGESLYIDCRFLCPTSNLCERFFSSAKFAQTDCRKSMLPQNFEAQMLLYFNMDLWGVNDVVVAMNGDTETE
ncbi:hypothetical protein H310_15220 [Aphanomyces invadans]|uniref:HAT C-terminal dimerisation domain-containing protein n=1 Tax=Aphanomyces invadans TaxID=157072 RepID=A0A024T8M1_9STRA|nr:hypothetical protein H310_15220 [Aphanomyces invadans]ETV89936.1 hypothetical protein H310_15220 [Aphanomyces invadans]|eukprot:XP_008881430.1 hypothetical protein H310_15220 [Aphanomyces invadans]